jgi:two-component system, NtrC family, sensor histidine kinase HydH
LDVRLPEAEQFEVKRAVPPDFVYRFVETLPSADPQRMGQAVDDRKQSATAARRTVFKGSTEVPKLPEMTAVLAHEIRNPLASIKGVADAFLQRGQLTQQEREWMETVRREVLKIDARLRELLDVSQSQVFCVRQCSLNELVSNVVVLAAHQAKTIHGRDVSIEFIDATTEPLLMHLDPARIEDAVLNLVLNAIESIEGNGRVTVCLRCINNHDTTHEASIEVSDTGCGIPIENRRHIFEPLFTTKREGTGLGLAAVRRTAAAYQGRITFKTRIGRGSKFILTLPLQPRHLTENPS